VLSAESGGQSLPKMLKAKDGLKQAHMDVLVAVLGRDCPPLALLQAPDEYDPKLIPTPSLKRIRPES